MGGYKIQALSYVSYELKKDYGRILNALKVMNDKYEWDKAEFIDDLRIRIEYGIPLKLVDLCKVEGIGKKFAEQLYGIGIRNRYDFKNRLSDIQEIGNERLTNVVKKSIISPSAPWQYHPWQPPALPGRFVKVRYKIALSYTNSSGFESLL